jgi:hypothetical protein
MAGKMSESESTPPSPSRAPPSAAATAVGATAADAATAINPHQAAFPGPESSQCCQSLPLNPNDVAFSPAASSSARMGD